MNKSERLQALDLITRVVKDKIPLTHLFASTKILSPFTKDLCFGVCRHYFQLAALADILVKKRPKETEVFVSILMGIYQLHFQNRPDYAVVKETVDVLTALKTIWAKGLVNAVLRNYCRKQPELLNAMEQNEAFQYNHPTWLIHRIKKAWPDDWQAILKANDEHPPMTLRVNARRESVKNYLKRLQNHDIHAEALSHSPEAIKLTTPCSVHLLPGFDDGDLSLQDEAAQLAVALLDLKPGLRVLDACAAPGGKTCHMLEKEPELRELVALDVDSKRLQRIHENLTRLKLHATLLTGDARQKEAWWDGVLFDRILLDAPCSATGVIRRHPDIKLLRTEKDIASIAAVQHELLLSVWPMLSPGGLLVYATCSVMPEENDQQIRRFMTIQKDAILLTKEGQVGRHTAHGLQILPGQHGMDGFFYSLLRRADR